MAQIKKQRLQRCYCTATQQDALCISTNIGITINNRTPKEWTEKWKAAESYCLSTAGFHYPHVVDLYNQINLAYSPISMC